MKRLALLWLACAAIGFAVAACAAVVIALAFDRGSTPRSPALTARESAAGAAPPTPGYHGQRLLDN